VPIGVTGGTEEQRALLTSILDGFGPSTIDAIELGEWVDTFDEHESLGRVPTAEEIEATRGTVLRLVDPNPPPIRAWWEARLVAIAFRARSVEQELEPVVHFAVGGGGDWLRWSAAPTLPELEPDQIQRMRREIAAAVESADAELQRLDILHPAGHAWALSVRVDEPHAFLRQRLRLLLESLEPWAEACGGQRYLEVTDGEAHPVLEWAQWAYGGMRSVRPDVTCCWGGSSSAIDAPPPTPCPVFD
jgi:hypothetical protein